MTLPIRSTQPRAPQHATPDVSSRDRLDRWIMASSDPAALLRLGIKATGGGPHQSKTMMLAELSTLLAGGHGGSPANAVLEENLVGKPSVRAREAALHRLRQLYALGEDAPVGIVMRYLWVLDPDARPLLALLCALARDPSFRAGADAVLDARLGEQVRWPAIAAAFDTVNSGRSGADDGKVACAERRLIMDASRLPEGCGTQRTRSAEGDTSRRRVCRSARQLVRFRRPRLLESQCGSTS